MYCLCLEIFDTRPAGVLLTRLTNDVDALGEVIGAGIVTIALDILMVVGCLAAMFYLNVELTILMLILSPLLVLLIELGCRQLKHLYLTIRFNRRSECLFVGTNRWGGNLQLFGGEDRSESHFDERNLKYRNASMTSIFTIH